jgi:hypothetical protein
MSRVVVSYRRPLNSEQLLVLSLLYRFRFGTAEYIAQYLGKTNIKVVQKKLRILEDQDFIAKRYNSSYKLAGKPAEYYLTPKGARLLSASTGADTRLADQVTPQGIKNLYKNTTVSTDFVAHCLYLFKVALHLQVLYGDRLTIFTRMQMIPFDYLPTWRPDLYLNLKTGAKGKGAPKRYLLDVWDGTRPFFVSVRKTRAYLKYAENGDWPTDQADFPSILVVCENNKFQKKLNRQIRKALDESSEDVIIFATAISEMFLAATQAKNKLWELVELYSDDDDSSLSSPESL